MTETNSERAARYSALENKYEVLNESDFKARSRRSILTGGLGVLAGYVGWRTLQGRPEVDGIPDVLREVHQKNEGLWRAGFRDEHLAPTFDRSKSSMIRVNGRKGDLETEIDLDSWTMSVIDKDGAEIGVHPLADVTGLEKHETTVEHKCVEGWSHIVTWGGYRFSDFVERHYPEMIDDPTEFVSLATPDRGYYVGLEWAAMMHPQTLLCTELQGEPLEQLHGAPLRLVTPLKYGIKQIKRIGSIEFTDTQPGDYWAERGYDWYSAL